jgi:AAHS family 3-hydroxyphenylpropionic acid transporter
MKQNHRKSDGRLALTIGLCFLVALMEGLDLQAAGIAAVGMAEAFSLDRMALGWVFSAGIIGLLPGALGGGWLADRYGRKILLLCSVTLFGLFSLATALAWDYHSLLFARLMTGVGLGAALPNLIALTSESAGPRLRGIAVSLMYCGVPLGAALAAAIGMGGITFPWQTVFWVGGVIPLLLVPLLYRYLDESRQFRARTVEDGGASLTALLRPGAVNATLLLWASYFFTLLVVYLLINWLPVLLVDQGFSQGQASQVMLMLQFGAALGTLALGALMDRLSPLAMALLIYCGMLGSLLALGMTSRFDIMLMVGFLAGLFATGGQCVLYALAPRFYQTAIRATGVGAAVAVGRLGAMTGPLLAGKMLAAGAGTAGVMATSAPGILVAGLAVFWLLGRGNRYSEGEAVQQG